MYRGCYASLTSPLSIILAAFRYVFTAWNVVEDPAHLGYVLRFVDHNDPAHWLEQTDPTKQVAMPAASVLFNNQLCTSFVRANATRYISNRGVALWKFPSDGTGSEEIIVYAPTSTTGVQAHYATRASGAGNGVVQYHLSGTTQHALFVADGSTIVNAAAGANPGINVATYSNFAFTSPNYVLRHRGTVIASGTQAASPAGNNPGTSLMWGSDGNSHADMISPMLCANPAELSAGQLTSVQRAIEALYAVPP